MSYQVEEVKAREQKTTKAGKPFVKYMLSLVDEGDQRFDVPFADFQNVNPSPGDKLDGFEIKDEGFGRELRKVGSGNGRKPGGKSPEEQKSITRQGAEQRAALYLIAKAMVKQHLDQDLTREDFVKLVNWMEQDAHA